MKKLKKSNLERSAIIFYLFSLTIGIKSLSRIAQLGVQVPAVWVLIVCSLIGIVLGLRPQKNILYMVRRSCFFICIGLDIMLFTMLPIWPWNEG